MPVFVQSLSFVVDDSPPTEVVDVPANSSLSDDSKDTCSKPSALVQPGPEHIIASDPVDTGRVEVDPVGASNTHPMVTQSKVGVFKPKTYVAELSMIEPKNIKEAIGIPSWKAVVYECIKL